MGKYKRYQKLVIRIMEFLSSGCVLLCVYKMHLLLIIFMRTLKTTMTYFSEGDLNKYISPINKGMLTVVFTNTQPTRVP